MLSKSIQPLALLAALLPAVSAQGGLFIVQCGPLTIQRGDPIVSPGKISSHVHAVVGGTAFDLEMSNEDARNSKSTTCNKMLDKSNYWQPQLYHQDRDGKFELIKLLGIVQLSPPFITALPNIQTRMPITSTGPATTRKDVRTAIILRVELRHQQVCAWLQAVH